MENKNIKNFCHNLEFSCIACLDDLLREEWWPAKNFFYDLIREPIKIACGIDIKTSPRHGEEHNLPSTFNIKHFINLCSLEGIKHWWEAYYRLSEKAENYISSHILENALIISYEMPPWLEKCILKSKAYFLDIRISPLRFGSDLYIAIRTNNLLINDRLRKYIIPDEEIRLEASLMAASVRHLRRYTSKNRSLDGSLIYIGQTAYDASLVSINGNFVRVAEFSDKIRELGKGKYLFYKPHPNAESFAKHEKEELERILGKSIKVCYENIYTLLGSDDNIELIGISSGSLQEAKYFNKNAYILYKPICDLEKYVQVRFNDFISPIFWYDILKPDCSPPHFTKLPSIRENHLRFLHNVWWGYSSFLIEGRHFFVECFERSGGLELKNRIIKLERDLYETKNFLKKILKYILSKEASLNFLKTLNVEEVEYLIKVFSSSEEEQKRDWPLGLEKSDLTEILQFLLRLKSKEFVIYGAGEAGYIFFRDFCKEFKVLPLCIMDRYSQRRFSEEVPTLKFPEEVQNLPRDLQIIVAVKSKDLYDEIREDLINEGFINIFFLDNNSLNQIQSLRLFLAIHVLKANAYHD
ncbi:MAG: hypothetical protein RMJ67_06905 [Elusimicrobiota bacterium]|nr:hypothetical protein [Endomicrobiia bacterium]MDW8135757.1 hypothetical protein [Thermodesulfobacterium sp.]MDW8166223.1 hypothetical protein [Elusimicrobiota bacterium]